MIFCSPTHTTTLKHSRLLRVWVESAEHGELMGAVPDDNSWQPRHPSYDSRHFSIDWEHTAAVCPQGKHSCSWSLAKTRSDRPVVKIKLRHADCSVCPGITLH